MNPRINTPQGEVIGVPPSDAEMNLASQKARDTFATFADAFDRRDASGSIFIVKAFFADPSVQGGGEHLWVTVQFISKSGIAGVVTSRPMFITAVKAGDYVEVSLPQLSDWLYVRDGKAVGGYTVQLLRSRMTREQKAQHDGAYPFSFE